MLVALEGRPESCDDVPSASEELFTVRRCVVCTPYSLVDAYGRFERTCCLHIQHFFWQQLAFELQLPSTKIHGVTSQKKVTLVITQVDSFRVVCHFDLLIMWETGLMYLILRLRIFRVQNRWYGLRDTDCAVLEIL